MTTPPHKHRVQLLAALSHAGQPSSDFDLNKELALPGGSKLRAAGVLLAVEGDQLILTRRSGQLRHHPGQIAFPGGKVEPSDAGPEAAALREAQEETGLDPAMVEVLGCLPPHETITGFQVTPVIGLVHGRFEARPDSGEVEEVFRVPLAHLTNPDNFRIEGRIWEGTKRYFYTVPYGPYYIWGATARILRALAGRVQDGRVQDGQVQP